MLAQGYVCETSPLGNVYYLPDGVTVTGDISINYMEYPWITCFEVAVWLFQQAFYNVRHCNANKRNWSCKSCHTGRQNTG